MKVELHILQNFAPSNLNRDDTGTPKSCEFGGYRRARVSSQALKRTARTYAQKNGALRITEKEENDPTLNPFSKGSMLFKTELVTRLVKKSGKNEQEARAVADFIFAETNLIKNKEDDKSGYRLVLGEAQFEQLRRLCENHWSAFADLLGNTEAEAKLKEAIKETEKEKRKIEKDQKKKDTPELQAKLKAVNDDLSKKKADLENAQKTVKAAEGNLKNVVKEAETILDTKSAADTAMFGRMITSAPQFSIDAASQVSHAISTNVVNDVELDYFAALDDLKDSKDPGAAHINTAEFNSACYYRYANVDIEQLQRNLKDGGNDLVRNTLEAFLQAFVLAVPTGKQNTFATPVPPSLVLAVIRDGARCSLANAFEKPISDWEKEEDGITGSSIRRLARHFNRLEELYGDFNGKRAAFVFTEEPEYLEYKEKKRDAEADGEEGKKQTKKLAAKDTASLKTLIDEVIGVVFPEDKPNGDQKGAAE
ncbi:MAG: type I-E CRISPR-associated protein Cas7/Cse4/CasC [Acidobacteria bacterium]|nr:type I-E CRISPR-associated protein Cas7/Cse4/CasC [Acidobacteriota bacterium]